MKVNELVESMTFSHRPQDGISVGFAVVAGVAYMSVGFVREGDYFSRKLAHRILAQRIVSTVEGQNVRYVSFVEHLPEKVDARSIVREFRKLFKPDPTCNDGMFSNITKFGSVEVRDPRSREQAYEQVVQMFDQAVNTVNATCV